MFDPFTGEEIVDGTIRIHSAAVQLGLEPPRFCAQCGRRMIVQIAPDGWWARCSRHGTVDSVMSEQR